MATTIQAAKSRAAADRDKVRVLLYAAADITYRLGSPNTAKDLAELAEYIRLLQRDPSFVAELAQIARAA